MTFLHCLSLFVHHFTIIIIYVLYVYSLSSSSSTPSVSFFRIHSHHHPSPLPRPTFTACNMAFPTHISTPIPTFLLSYSPFIAFPIHHSLPSHLPMKPSQKNLSYITTQGIHPTQQSNPPQSQSTHFTPPGCLCPHPPKDRGFVIEIVLVALAVEVVLGGMVYR